jgi:hypothetical protein
MWRVSENRANRSLITSKYSSPLLLQDSNQGWWQRHHMQHGKDITLLCSYWWYHLGGLGVYEWIILKWTLLNMLCWINLAQYRIHWHSCEPDNEPSSSIKGSKFLCLLWLQYILNNDDALKEVKEKTCRLCDSSRELDWRWHGVKPTMTKVSSQRLDSTT